MAENRMDQPIKDTKLKTKGAIKRLKSRRTAKSVLQQPPLPEPERKKFSQKDAEKMLIDVSLQALYNNGDKRDLDFVSEILHPNEIKIPEGKALESFWDILTSTGLMKAVIGFGKHGRLSLTTDGYNLMNRFGSYANYLHERQQEREGHERHPFGNQDDEPMDGIS